MRFDRLAETLRPAHEALVAHPLYRSLDDRGRLQRFMAVHVFAVWDFMSLLKVLQQRLTTVTTPWMPPRHRKAARLVNEIVLGEETDEVKPGVFMSHFELYLAAMKEVGADGSAIEGFLGTLQAGTSIDEALRGVERAGTLPGVTPFVATTFALAGGTTEAVAAAFLVGREKLVPEMFEELLRGTAGIDAPNFRLYLERHVHLDGEQHGPMAVELLTLLCGDDDVRWGHAERAAREALAARKALWDAVLAAG